MRIPWWLGPAIGPVVGGLAYLQFGPGNGQAFDPEVLAAFVGIGLFAGCLVGLGDLVSPPPRRDGRQESLRPWQRTKYVAGGLLMVLATPFLVVGALNTRDRGFTAFGAACLGAGVLLFVAGAVACRKNRGRPVRE